MPLYEYECKACSIAQEVMQKISDPAPPACPQCGQGPMTKLMSKTGFILKGGGWYVTDFRGGSKPAATSTEGATPAEAAKTSDAPGAASATESPKAAAAD